MKKTFIEWCKADKTAKRQKLIADILSGVIKPKDPWF